MTATCDQSLQIIAAHIDISLKNETVLVPYASAELECGAIPAPDDISRLF